jgi:hypothetical protein
MVTLATLELGTLGQSWSLLVLGSAMGSAIADMKFQYVSE